MSRCAGARGPGRSCRCEKRGPRPRHGAARPARRAYHRARQGDPGPLERLGRVKDRRRIGPHRASQQRPPDGFSGRGVGHRSPSGGATRRSGDVTGLGGGRRGGLIRGEAADDRSRGRDSRRPGTVTSPRYPTPVSRASSMVASHAHPHLLAGAEDDHLGLECQLRAELTPLIVGEGRGDRRRRHPSLRRFSTTNAPAARSPASASSTSAGAPAPSPGVQGARPSGAPSRRMPGGRRPGCRPRPPLRARNRRSGAPPPRSSGGSPGGPCATPPRPGRVRPGEPQPARRVQGRSQ